MSYNGSGTFQINTSGQPVVTGTVISSSAFNALTADLATGLSTAITKDGQTATTVRIPFAQGINSSLTTDTSSGSTGSIYTAGGVGITKGLFVGGTATFSATPVFSALTASSAVATDASKNLVSVTNTGTGNNVLSASPTLTGTIAGASLSLSSLTVSSAVATDASKNLVSVTNTGTGSNVLATSPTLVTPVLGAASATSVTVGAGAVGTPSITTTGDTNTGIFFPAADTIAFTEGGAEAMRIDSSGNMGIGTTSPNTKLELYSSQNANVELLRLNNPDVNGLGTQIGFTQGSTTYSQIINEYSSGWRMKIGAGVPTGTTAGDAGYFTFFTNNGSSSYAERMRIDSSGNVLVGTTTRSNDEKFTINQSANAMGISVRSNGGPALGNYESADTNHNTYWTFGRDNATTGNFVFGYGGTLRGSISNSTGVYTSSSDSRLKKNITNITYGLNEVMGLRPVTYLMNEEANTAKKHLGFIAQEVKALVDEAVDDLIDPDTQFYMLDKAGLVPVLVKAMQEQQALITSLTERIVALEAK